MDIGEVCVMIMLMVWLLMWYVDNLDIDMVKYNTQPMVSQFYPLGRIFSVFQFDVPLPNIPILLDDVMCSGNETSLLQCLHSGFYNHDCYPDEDIVMALQSATKMGCVFLM